jgi:hypothetical protein
MPRIKAARKHISFLEAIGGKALSRRRHKFFT